MGLLQWEEVKGFATPFLKAYAIDLNMDFIDLCEGRFWGGSKFYLTIKFSIHERINKDEEKGWNYQLLAPNGIHIYCKDVDEAKCIAEEVYNRIRNALAIPLGQQAGQIIKEQCLADEIRLGLREPENKVSIARQAYLDKVQQRRELQKTKFKTRKLSFLLENRGINGRVWYSRMSGMIGWMFSYKGGDPQWLGSNYAQSLEHVQSGTLDFLKGNSDEGQSV